MKKLKKLKLHELEMHSIVGGYRGSGTYDDPYQLPECSVEAKAPCPECVAAHKWLESSGYAARSKGLCYAITGIAHCCGYGNHTSWW